MFTRRISSVVDQPEGRLVDLRLDACCNPNRFFEGSCNFYDFAKVDNSFGDPHTNPNVDGLAERTRSMRLELDEPPAKRPRTVDTVDFNEGASFDMKPRKRLVRLKPSINQKRKGRVVRSRPNVEKFFDNDVAVGLGDGEGDRVDRSLHQHDESGDDLDGDSDESESVMEREKRVGLGENFQISTREMNKSFFTAIKIKATNETNPNLPMSTRVANVLRLSIDSFVAKSRPVKIIPFDATKRENHVPYELSRMHCDSIPPDQSKSLMKIMTTISKFNILFVSNV